MRRRPAEWRIDGYSKIKKKSLSLTMYLHGDCKREKLNLEFLRDLKDLALNLETSVATLLTLGEAELRMKTINLNFT